MPTPVNWMSIYQKLTLFIGLHLNQKLDIETFWALWEYQFSDLNPFGDSNDLKLQQLFSEVEKALKN
jgi:hypothetical protein